MPFHGGFACSGSAPYVEFYLAVVIHNNEFGKKRIHINYLFMATTKHNTSNFSGRHFEVIIAEESRIMHTFICLRIEHHVFGNKNHNLS